MRLVRLLSNLGYGSQKDSRALIRAGRVTLADGTPLDQDSRAEHENVRLDGAPLDPPAGIVLMMNKPEGFTCSTADQGRVVYELLPPRFARRKPIIAPVGRLDRDTSGLLLLTDDGALLHRIISPNSAIPKTYKVQLADALSGNEGALFASGTLMLRSETKPLLPAMLEPLDERSALITITEGRYHQVRRMFAAAGNRVETLQRVGIGGLTLGDLPPGQWRILDADDVARIFP